jgi:hypothetical protein
VVSLTSLSKTQISYFPTTFSPRPGALGVASIVDDWNYFPTTFSPRPGALGGYIVDDWTETVGSKIIRGPCQATSPVAIEFLEVALAPFAGTCLKIWPDRALLFLTHGVETLKKWLE